MTGAIRPLTFVSYYSDSLEILELYKSKLSTLFS